MNQPLFQAVLPHRQRCVVLLIALSSIVAWSIVGSPAKAQFLENTFEIVRPTIDDLPDWVFEYAEIGHDSFNTFGYFDINDQGVIAGVVAIEPPPNSYQELFHLVFRYRDGVFDFIDTRELGYNYFARWVSINEKNEMTFIATWGDSRGCYYASPSGKITKIAEYYEEVNDLTNSGWVLTLRDELINVRNGERIDPDEPGLISMNHNGLVCGVDIGLNVPIIWSMEDGVTVFDDLGFEGFGLLLNDVGDFVVVNNDGVYEHYLVRKTDDGWELDGRMEPANEIGSPWNLSNDLVLSLRTNDHSRDFPAPGLWTKETGVINLYDILPPEAEQFQLLAPPWMNNRHQLVGQAQWGGEKGRRTFIGGEKGGAKRGGVHLLTH